MKEKKTSKGEVNKVKLDFNPIVIQTTVYIKNNLYAIKGQPTYASNIDLEIWLLFWLVSVFCCCFFYEREMILCKINFIFFWLVAKIIDMEQVMLRCC